MGNVTIANLKKRVQGSRRSVVLDVTLSASYATNGDSIVAADLETIARSLNVFDPSVADKGLVNGLEAADAEMGSDGTSLFFDRVNSKIKAFSGRAEVANATALNVTPGAIRVELIAKSPTGN